MSELLYDSIGVGYSRYRQPDPRIAAHIDAGLGSTRTILNVGAGTGSYEPLERIVVAVEPSAQMVRQRHPSSAQVVRASADRLPFRDSSFDAALAILTIHHWSDWRLGLNEMRRVATDRVVLLTWDPEHPAFWLVRDYFHELLAIDRPLFPTVSSLEAMLGSIDVRPVRIPFDCLDGFLGAYWRRPQAYLDANVRRAISSFSRLTNAEPGLQRLRSDLADGVWQRRNAELLTQSQLDLGYRVVIARK